MLWEMPKHHICKTFSSFNQAIATWVFDEDMHILLHCLLHWWCTYYDKWHKQGLYLAFLHESNDNIPPIGGVVVLGVFSVDPVMTGGTGVEPDGVGWPVEGFSVDPLVGVSAVKIQSRKKDYDTYICTDSYEVNKPQSILWISFYLYIRGSNPPAVSFRFHSKSWMGILIYLTLYLKHSHQEMGYFAILSRCSGNV